MYAIYTGRLFHATLVFMLWDFVGHQEVFRCSIPNLVGWLYLVLLWALAQLIVAEELAVRPNSPLQARLKCFGNSCASDRFKSDSLTCCREKDGKSIWKYLADFGNTLAKDGQGLLAKNQLREVDKLPRLNPLNIWTALEGKSIREFAIENDHKWGAENKISDVILFKSSLPYETSG